MSEILADLAGQEPLHGSSCFAPDPVSDELLKRADKAAGAALHWLTHLLVGTGAGVLVLVYAWVALSGGLSQVLYSLQRESGPADPFYPQSRSIYHLHPFDEMFFPLRVSGGGATLVDPSPAVPARRSLVVFTSGRSGIANVDALVRAWGLRHFDYVICHFDESQHEWAKLEWYSQVVRFSAHRQGKMWFFKRALTPWLAENYGYVHFVDSDAGSPPEQPFDMLAYERVLLQHDVILGQPAVTDKDKSSVHNVCRQHGRCALRWTDFVENGPLFSVRVAGGGFQSLWEMVDPAAVSGYGVDMRWCQYLSQRKGFPLHRTCAVVDAHAIDHLDTHSATAQVYGGEGQGYAFFGNQEWKEYGRIFGGKVDGKPRMKTYQCIAR